MELYAVNSSCDRAILHAVKSDMLDSAPFLTPDYFQGKTRHLTVHFILPCFLWIVAVPRASPVVGSSWLLPDFQDVHGNSEDENEPDYGLRALPHWLFSHLRLSH